jgi:hypothetical protein
MKESNGGFAAKGSPLKSWGTRSSRAQPPDWDQAAGDSRFPGPKTRNPARIALLVSTNPAIASYLIYSAQGFIRKCIILLQGRSSAKDLLPPGPPEDIKEPTAKEFYFKWNEPYQSLFNVAACNIVTSKVLETWNGLLTEDERDEVFDMVAAHLKYLITQYRRQQLAPEDLTEIQRRKRSSSDRRKRTVSV